LLSCWFATAGAGALIFRNADAHGSAIFQQRKQLRAYRCTQYRRDYTDGAQAPPVRRQR